MLKIRELIALGYEAGPWSPPLAEIYSQAHSVNRDARAFGCRELRRLLALGRGMPSREIPAEYRVRALNQMRLDGLTPVELEALLTPVSFGAKLLVLSTVGEA